ncbi:MAG: FkbM family methyltransferase [Bacteroidota bacterium]
MKKIYTYLAYFWQYIKYGDFKSIYYSIYFLLTQKSNAEARLVKSGLGSFYTRANTLDFQYINYAYELGVKKFIEQSDFDVYIDAGACVGEFSVWLAKEGKKCIAFEPVKNSYELILKNTALNNVESKVQVLNYGLGRKHAVEYFLVDHLNMGASKKVDYVTDEKFEINRLDDVFEGFNLKKSDRILVKIDVEGMEIDLLEGARNFLNYFDEVILIIEEKLSGEGEIKNYISKNHNFEFGLVDHFNMYARTKK